MKIPSNLKKGDCIAIVATARSVNASDLKEAIQLAESWGLKVVIGSSIGKIQNQFAGSDAERSADLQTQINNPKLKAIWCAKGGYGSVRILDLVDFSSLQNQPKWIIGYSDVTAIHCHLQTLGVASLHAQMPVGISSKTETSASTLRDVLFGKKMHYCFANHPFNQTGKVSATLMGGNLSVLYSLCGSASFPKLENVILLLEDLDEYLYHIDRMMQNLKQNGVFKNLAGIVIGGMTDMNDNRIPFGKTAEEIIHEYVSELKIPVAFGVSFGHLKENLAIPFGKEVHLMVSEKGTEIQF
ncbi:S66 peptidase family protein [Psychroflexus salis]|uniref:Peptidase S66 n=1 Tax=Psychroflexus salis TaxID=1526574 RepID=A0A916ZM81_9FLAO|nr:LD-carboxypeptidase [Psychroflexus salis]GGE03996.1 peptidase S66 [Psychroflexus salis]